MAEIKYQDLTIDTDDVFEKPFVLKVVYLPIGLLTTVKNLIMSMSQYQNLISKISRLVVALLTIVLVKPKTLASF